MAAVTSQATERTRYGVFTRGDRRGDRSPDRSPRRLPRVNAVLVVHEKTLLMQAGGAGLKSELTLHTCSFTNTDAA